MGLPAVLAVAGGASAVVGLVGFALWKCCTYLSNRNAKPSKSAISIDPIELMQQSAHTDGLTHRKVYQGNSAEK